VNCDEYEEMMSALVDGMLDPAASPVLFAHLGACAGCQEYLRHLLRLKNTAAEDALEAGATGAWATMDAHGERAPSADTTARNVPAGRPRTPDRPARRLAGARIQVSVPGAALALIMVVLWTLALTATVFSDQGPGFRQRELLIPGSALPWQADPPGQFSVRQPGRIIP